MKGKFNRTIMTLVGLLVIASMLFGCVPATQAPVVEEPTAAPAAAEKIKVGLSFSDFATERWKNEEVLLRGMLEAKGYEVLSQEANHDVKAQNDQIDNMVSQGVKGLIVIAEDGDAIVTSVEKAADAGVLVIAYDRLIKIPQDRCLPVLQQRGSGPPAGGRRDEGHRHRELGRGQEWQGPPGEVGRIPDRQQRDPVPPGPGRNPRQVRRQDRNRC